MSTGDLCQNSDKPSFLFSTDVEIWKKDCSHLATRKPKRGTREKEKLSPGNISAGQQLYSDQLKLALSSFLSSEIPSLLSSQFRLGFL